MIERITGTAAFDKAVEKGESLVVFSAPWCGFCRRLRPMMEKISEEVNFPVYGINCDTDEELAKRYNVETIPNLIFMKDGKPADSMIGGAGVGYPQLKAFIEKNQ